MKRKLKIITAGTASLALLAPIGTVIACGDRKSSVSKSGDPKSDDLKMLSFDEFQKSIIEAKLGSDKAATATQKASLKAIYDTFSLEKFKTFKISSEIFTKIQGKVETKEETINEEIKASVEIYLLSKKGAPLQLLKDGWWNSYKDEPDMLSDQKEMAKSIRDNFMNEKSINKYLLTVVKYTNKNGKSNIVTNLDKIIKKDNEIGGKEIMIFQ